MSALVISTPQEATIPIPPPLPSVASKATRAPVSWVGGKFYLAKWLIEHMPQHRVYVEPFAGMANVLLKKTPAEVEIINDLDERVVNFFRVLRDPNLFGELQRRCCLTPYSRQQFASILETDESEACPVEKAWRFFTRCRQARGGMGMSAISANAWAMSTRTRRQMAEPVSKYLSAIDGLEAVVQRLREVVIEFLPATDLLRKYDSDDAFFYCDPPYLHETRPNKVEYGVEMTDDQHRAFLNQARGCAGKVMISGYPSDLYDSLLSGWQRIEERTRVQCSNSGNDRTEVIWMNYQATTQTSTKPLNEFESSIQ